MNEPARSAAALSAMSLLAVVRAGLGAARQISNRRSGRDPSEQEPEAPVRADLTKLRAELAEYTVRIRLRAVVGEPEAPVAALAQAFEDRLLLDDLARTSRRVHQKLLSLYPLVSEGVVEEARLFAAEADAHAASDEVGGHLATLAHRLPQWLDTLNEALA